MRAQQQRIEWLVNAIASAPDRRLAATAMSNNQHNALTIMKLLEKEARYANLDKPLTRMEQKEINQVHLLFEQVGFDEIMAWLEQVRSSTGLHPKQISLRKIPHPGSVKAILVF